MRKRIGIPVALFVVALLFPAGASASFHLMKISEVYPGTPAFFDSAFVELQMYQGGQNLVNGHTVTMHDSNGLVSRTFTFTDDVANGQSQRTILIADQFPPNSADADFTDTGLGSTFTAAGGAVCFEDIDCVAWGSITPPGLAALPSPAGTPAPVISEGSSLTRSIARGCPTFLEALDDTDDSAADFALTAEETPRPNSVVPTETPCDPPETIISKGPRKQSTKRKAKFRFSSPDAVTGFECSLDGKAFKPCSSPKKYKRLKRRKHTFEVRAIGAIGPDPSPATYKWKVRKPKR